VLHHPLRRIDHDPLVFLDALAAEARDGVAPCRIGRREAFLVTAPALVEEVLVRRAPAFEKGRGYLRAARLVGGGLLTASGARHAVRRRLLQPAFHRARLAAWAGTMTAHAASLRDRWRAGMPVDVAAEMQALSLDIAGATLFGADLSACAADVRHAVASAVSPFDGLLAVVAPPRHLRGARDTLGRIVETILEARPDGGGRDDLLDLVMGQAGDDPARVRDEAVTFLLAAHDTIALALTWTWVLLAAHPGSAVQLQEELDAVLDGRRPAAADLDALPVTRAVFAEALRLRPPAWVIVREAMGPDRLGSMPVPAGSLVIISPWVLHRDPHTFPDPERFAPDRWRDADARPPKFAYLPFGAGGRSCIGEQFAWMEGMLVLATIAQRWRLAGPAGTVRPAPRMTLRPAGPVRLLPVPAPAYAGRS
jgi:cytochrome P450